MVSENLMLRFYTRFYTTLTVSCFFGKYLSHFGFSDDVDLLKCIICIRKNTTSMYVECIELLISVRYPV